MTSHTKVSLNYPLAESEICLIEQLNTLCRGEKTCSSLTAENMFKSPKLKQHSPPSLHNAAVSVGASHSPCAQDSGKHWPNSVVQRIRPKRQVPTSLLPTKRLWKKSTWPTYPCDVPSVAAFSRQKRLFPVSLHCHLTVNRKTIGWCPHTSLSHHRCHPGSPECCYLTHPLWVTELGSQIYLEAWCSLCSSLHKVDGSSEKLEQSKGKSSLFSNTEILLSSAITVWSKERDMCPNGQVWELHHWRPPIDHSEQSLIHFVHTRTS